MIRIDRAGRPDRKISGIDEMVGTSNKLRTATARVRGPRRMAPEMRREQILSAATAMLGNQGANFNTRELAARLNISHPLLFKYFQSKDEIVDAVFQTVFMRRFSDDIRSLVDSDREDTIQKWIDFYEIYTPKIFDETWIRVFISSALQQEKISSRYFDQVVIPLVKRLADDTEMYCLGKIEPDHSPVRQITLELAWSLHSSLFYSGLRRWVYRLEVPKDIASMMAARVKVHFAGASTVLRDLQPQLTG